MTFREKKKMDSDLKNTKIAFLDFPERVKLIFMMFFGTSTQKNLLSHLSITT